MIPLDQLRPFAADRIVASPNHGSRRGAPISLIVLHATADAGNESGAEAWMTTPGSQASAHLHIRRDGSVTRLVDDSARAWHAGVSRWPGVADVNSESLGWELANRNDGREAYTPAQYRTVARLLHHYLPQGLARAAVVSHAEIAPGRKADPLGWRWDRMWALLDELEAPPIPAPAPLPKPTPPPPVFVPPNLPAPPPTPSAPQSAPSLWARLLAVLQRRF